jgi:hypothetical protein
MQNEIPAEESFCIYAPCRIPRPQKQRAQPWGAGLSSSEVGGRGALGFRNGCIFRRIAADNLFQAERRLNRMLAAAEIDIEAIGFGPLIMAIFFNRVAGLQIERHAMAAGPLFLENLIPVDGAPASASAVFFFLAAMIVSP